MSYAPSRASQNKVLSRAGHGTPSTAQGSPSTLKMARRTELAKKITHAIRDKVNAYARSKGGNPLSRDDEFDLAKDVQGFVMNHGAISEHDVRDIEARYKQRATQSSRGAAQYVNDSAHDSSMEYAHTEPETVQVKESARTREVPEKKESARTRQPGRREPHVDDEWAQLARFQDMEGNTRKAQEAQAREEQKRLMRLNLEAQLQEKKDRKQREKEQAAWDAQERERIAKKIIDDQKEAEAKRRAAMDAERAVREAQIRDARKAKEEEKARRQAEDKETLSKINEDLRKGKEEEMNKKAKMLEEWKRTVEENEANDIAKAHRREKEREEARLLSEEYANVEKEREKRRSEDLERKLMKQKHIESTIGASVMKSVLEREKEDEERALRFQRELDERERKNELAKRENFERKKALTNTELKRQLAEKERRKREAEAEQQKTAEMLRALAIEEANAKAAEKAKLKEQRLHYQSVLRQQQQEHDEHLRRQTTKMTAAEAGLNKKIFDKVKGL